MARKKKEAAGVPDWVVTFSDMMTLLLCFFVIIVSMSEVKKNDRYYQVLQSLKEAFGGEPQLVGTIREIDSTKNTIIERLLAVDLPSWTRKQGDTREEAIEGRKWRVTDVRKGVNVVIGGRITFDRFSATLNRDAKRLVAATAEAIRGHNLMITVRGHATREPLPATAAYEDARDLSYARAKAVARELERSGIRAGRILCVAAGDTEPLVVQAFTEEERALNRRVEIVVTEDTIEDYLGQSVEDVTEPSDEAVNQEPSDGG